MRRLGFLSAPQPLTAERKPRWSALRTLRFLKHQPGCSQAPPSSLRMMPLRHSAESFSWVGRVALPVSTVTFPRGDLIVPQVAYKPLIATNPQRAS